MVKSASSTKYVGSYESKTTGRLGVALDPPKRLPKGKERDKKKLGEV